MCAERLGSYSIASTVAGMSRMLRLKSMTRYSCLWPPPMRREVSRPYALRPPVLCLGSVSARWGRFFERPTGLFSEVNRWEGRRTSAGEKRSDCDPVAGNRGTSWRGRAVLGQDRHPDPKQVDAGRSIQLERYPW